MRISSLYPMKALYTQWITDMSSALSSYCQGNLYPSAAAMPHNLGSRSPLGGGPVHLPGWPHMLSLPLHLRQCRLSLGQPQGHLHGAVQVDSGSEGSTGLFSPADLGVEGAEAVVAVGLERAHAQLLG